MSNFLQDVIDERCRGEQRRTLQACDNSKFKASDAGRCQLMRYWKREGKPGDPFEGVQMLRAKQIKSNLRKWIQTALDKQGILIGAGGKISNDDIDGTYDMLLDDDSSIILYSFKLLSSENFNHKSLYKDWVILRHKHQILTCFDLISDCDVSACRIVYINRDTLMSSEHEIDIKQKYIALSQDWQELIVAWHLELPPEPTKHDWECRYCQFLQKCSEKT